MGRDAGCVRGASPGCTDRCRHAAGLGQRAARQDAAALRADLCRRVAAQSDRQGAETGIARAVLSRRALAQRIETSEYTWLDRPTHTNWQWDKAWTILKARLQ